MTIVSTTGRYIPRPPIAVVAFMYALRPNAALMTKLMELVMYGPENKTAPRA